VARDRTKRPEATALRLFVAIEIPAEARNEVAAAIAPWRGEFPHARWVPAQNWHVTMKFLGATYPRLRGWVEERVGNAAARASPFSTRIVGLGSFPSARRARVVWAGLDDADGRMAALAGGVDDSLARRFEAERRPFTAHLTVARSDPPLRLPEGFVETPLETPSFEVDRLVLFRSHLRRPAPRYEPLATFPLG
jgi:RNA 2',3'-cyclic 3'-phosphodiesterase